jgi:NADPH:quinone reductase-like Zn-dependent oxidoreductase
VRLMERPLPFLGVVKTGPLLAVDLVRRTRNVAPLASRSTSCQRRPRSSPILKPAVTAERLGRLLEAGILRVPIQHTYGFDQAGEALEALATAHTQGKRAIQVT